MPELAVASEIPWVVIGLAFEHVQHRLYDPTSAILVQQFQLCNALRLAYLDTFAWSSFLRCILEPDFKY